MTYPDKDIVGIERHLSALNALESFPPNVAMLQRLKDGLASPEDINFYQHEMIEAGLMAEGLDARTAHLRTLDGLRIFARWNVRASPTNLATKPGYITGQSFRTILTTSTPPPLRRGGDDAMGAVHPTSRIISAPVEIVGERSKHLGPRIDYARVGLRAEPSGRFEVVDLVPRDDKARAFGFPEMFVRGVLDGLGGGAPPPLRLILQSADHHPIDSSPHAFVEAGRDAGRKLREHEGLI